MRASWCKICATSAGISEGSKTGLSTIMNATLAVGKLQSLANCLWEICTETKCAGARARARAQNDNSRTVSRARRSRPIQGAAYACTKGARRQCVHNSCSGAGTRWTETRRRASWSEIRGTSARISEGGPGKELASADRSGEDGSACVCDQAANRERKHGASSLRAAREGGGRIPQSTETGTYLMRLSWMIVFHADRSLWKCWGENASWKSAGCEQHSRREDGRTHS